MARVFDGTGFVDADVSRRGGEDPFIAVQQGVDDDGVGLGTAIEEMDFSIGAVTGLAYFVLGAGTDFISAVSTLSCEIHGCQFF